MTSTPHGTLGTILVLIGTVILLCAGVAGPLLGLLLNAGTPQTPSSQSEGAVNALLAPFAFGAFLCIVGQALKRARDER